MTKEEIHVVLPMKAFDTYKMDSWTPEQWKKFVGEETGPVSIQLLLLNDNEFYLKIMGVSFREVTEEMFFGFEAQNKFNRNITIQFGKWIIYLMKSLYFWRSPLALEVFKSVYSVLI